MKLIILAMVEKEIEVHHITNKQVDEEKKLFLSDLVGGRVLGIKHKFMANKRRSKQDTKYSMLEDIPFNGQGKLWKPNKVTDFDSAGNEPSGLAEH